MAEEEGSPANGHHGSARGTAVVGNELHVGACSNDCCTRRRGFSDGGSCGIGGGAEEINEAGVAGNSCGTDRGCIELQKLAFLLACSESMRKLHSIWPKKLYAAIVWGKRRRGRGEGVGFLYLLAPEGIRLGSGGARGGGGGCALMEEAAAHRWHRSVGGS
uniref:Uncharacterized protein n=1 Tax=Oryza punctata TaxID=4537 RepID=A0A0E0JXE6_ORYPU